MSFIPKLKVYLKSRTRIFVVAGVLLIGVAALHASVGNSAATAEEALVQELASRGLDAERDEIIWWEDSPDVVTMSPVVFLASERGGLRDLYYAEVRRSGGTLLEVGLAYNLTRSPRAREELPVRVGDELVYSAWARGAYSAFTRLDMRGEAASVTEGWSQRARWQNSVTNRQSVGRWAGIGRSRYTLLAPAQTLVVSAQANGFRIEADGSRVIELSSDAIEVQRGGELCEMTPEVKGQPGTITWVVDSIRNLSFVGPAPIEWLEHRVFAVKDMLTRLYHAAAGQDAESAAQEAADAMGLSRAETRRRLELAVVAPESGLPPGPLGTLLSPALEGEGEWVPVVDDPFLRSYPGAPTAFYQTFWRPDEERPYSQIYAVLWDSRLIQLNIMSGTREPEGATGATAPGMAPRDPETLESFVGGFNGGFQALHGEFGMMAEGEVYLPPKPWAATVAVMRDGQVGIGSWLGPPPGVRFFREGWAIEQIPEEMLSFRQNLTSVVEGEEYNPWGRWWWGAAPASATEQTYIHRTGLCLRPDGAMVYLWGRALGPEALGRAMQAVDCIRGMHLDMNSRHTGFEFYNVRRASEPHPPLGRELGESEFQGPVPHADGMIMRSRRAVRTMVHMRFPRYISRDPRDFFYLTTKPVLPGNPLPGDPRAVFSSEGLPHAGWPHALARAQSGRMVAVRIDPHRAVTERLGGDPSEQVLAMFGARQSTESSTEALYGVRNGGRWSYGVGEPPEGAVVVISGARLEDAPAARAAVGIDAMGFWLYVERASDDPRSLAGLVRMSGIEHAIALDESQHLSFNVEGRWVSPDGFEREVEPTAGAVVLHANTRPAARVLFPEVEPRGYRDWGWIQDSRVRYFRDETRPARFTGPGAAPQ